MIPVIQWAMLPLNMIKSNNHMHILILMPILLLIKLGTNIIMAANIHNMIKVKMEIITTNNMLSNHNHLQLLKISNNLSLYKMDKILKLNIHSRKLILTKYLQLQMDSIPNNNIKITVTNTTNIMEFILPLTLMLSSTSNSIINNHQLKNKLEYQQHLVKQKQKKFRYNNSQDSENICELETTLSR